jgi:hypothetical protein
MTDDAKQQAAQLHEAYGLALRIARSHWPDPTPPEVLASAVHTVFIELCRPSRPHAAPTVNGAGAAAPPPCPKCGGVMQSVPRTSPRTPDYRCPDRACATPVWLRPKAGAR